MGFGIWAVGLRGFNSKGNARSLFHYSKSNCLDQGDFEPPKLLSMIPNSPDLGGVAKKIVGTPSSHVGGATVGGMFAMAGIISARQVQEQIKLLRIHGQGGSISVYCYQKKWYWADTNSFVNCYISGGNPGRDFLKKIGPGLKKTELNNFGVLMQIAMLLSEYSLKLPNSATPNLKIEIRH